MSVNLAAEYLSIGGNRHTAASAWSSRCGALAFGADQNLAIWHPLDSDKTGIRQILNGHRDRVNAVAFQFRSGSKEEILLSGSADGQLIIWKLASQGQWVSLLSVKAHVGAINAISTLNDSDLFVTGSADAEVKLWQIEGDSIKAVNSFVTKPRIIPLALVLFSIPSVQSNEALFIAIGGTRNDVQVYALRTAAAGPVAELQATLRGHESWIHSLALKRNGADEMVLASASHDKYVRIWKIRPGEEKHNSLAASDGEGSTPLMSRLTAKAQTITFDAIKYSITFDALLLGHEDWVYSAAWNPDPDSDQLLTASADGSLAIWEPDPSSGIWISASKLGEISDQKGATTATGSAGGFWTGIWSPDGQFVTCLGRTGSWRLWQYDRETQYWIQQTGISGHTSSANDLSWSPSAEYLLSTSADQTTRLHAAWQRQGKRTWHEFSRPQIHGYDLNCVSSTSPHQFASGADEKLLRVFNQPRDVARMLHKLCNIEMSQATDLADAAAMPVLGLSNKAMTEGDESLPELSNGYKEQEYVALTGLDVPLADIAEPPTEDILARHTLWPEHEKLYGHGYEISQCAYAPSENLLATACKASSTDHAVIRLYDGADWHEIKPSLAAHSLTATRLIWSNTADNMLLSVGRDRQWAVFKQADDEGKTWKLLQSNPKAHTRMILDAAWAPAKGSKTFFATAGRDKTVKIWHQDVNETFIDVTSIKRDSAVTALSMTPDPKDGSTILAVGEESGAISLHLVHLSADISIHRSLTLPQQQCPSKSITRLEWQGDFEGDGNARLAVAAMDCSVRILRIHRDLLVE